MFIVASVLNACSEERRLQAGIEEFLSRVHGLEIWCLPSTDDKFNLRTGFERDDPPAQYIRQLNVLKNAGLVDRTEGPNQSIVFTELGLKHFVKNATWIGREKRVHCIVVGTSKFVSIENRATQEQKIEKIVFVYKVTDIPDWTKATEAIAVFPALVAVAKTRAAHDLLSRRAGYSEPFAPLFKGNIELRQTAKEWMELSKYRMTFGD